MYVTVQSYSGQESRLRDQKSRKVTFPSVRSTSACCRLTSVKQKMKLLCHFLLRSAWMVVISNFSYSTKTCNWFGPSVHTYFLYPHIFSTFSKKNNIDWQLLRWSIFKIFTGHLKLSNAQLSKQWFFPAYHLCYHVIFCMIYLLCQQCIGSTPKTLHFLQKFILAGPAVNVSNLSPRLQVK